MILAELRFLRTDASARSLCPSLFLPATPRCHEHRAHPGQRQHHTCSPPKSHEVCNAASNRQLSFHLPADRATFELSSGERRNRLQPLHLVSSRLCAFSISMPPSSSHVCPFIDGAPLRRSAFPGADEPVFSHARLASGARFPRDAVP